MTLKEARDDTKVGKKYHRFGIRGQDWGFTKLSSDTMIDVAYGFPGKLLVCEALANDWEPVEEYYVPDVENAHKVSRTAPLINFREKMRLSSQQGVSVHWLAVMLKELLDILIRKEEHSEEIVK